MTEFERRLRAAKPQFTLEQLATAAAFEIKHLIQYPASLEKESVEMNQLNAISESQNTL